MGSLPAFFHVELSPYGDGIPLKKESATPNFEQLVSPRATIQARTSTQMATEIKAIICPQCGSTRNAEIRPKHYRCGHCHTEYFLDTNEVNVNLHHQYQQAPPRYAYPPNKKPTKYAIAIVGSFLALFALVNISTGIFRNRTAAGRAAAGGSISPLKSIEGRYSATTSCRITLATENSEDAVGLILANRNYFTQSPAHRNGVYVGFYNAVKKTLLKEQRLDLDEAFSPSACTIRRFSNGVSYAVLGNSKVYEVDGVNLSLKDATSQLVRSQSSLQSGLATIELVSADNGDGFSIMTNDGKRFYLYPVANKIYSEDELYKAEHGLRSLLPEAKDKLYFTFTSKSNDFPEEKLQLLKIVYKDNGGGPKDLPSFASWHRDFGRSGIFTEADPYQKVIFGNTEKERSRIVSFQILSPDRLYFDPAVVYQDAEYLLIKAKANANPSSGLSLQSLDRATGAVKWSVALKKDRLDDVARHKDRFQMFVDSDEMLVLDVNGKTIGEYKVQ